MMLKTDFQYAIAFPFLVWILKPWTFTVPFWLVLGAAWLFVLACQRAAGGTGTGFLPRFVMRTTDTMLIALAISIVVVFVVGGIWAISGGIDSVTTRLNAGAESGLASPDGRIVVATEILPWAIILAGTPLRMRRASS